MRYRDYQPNQMHLLPPSLNEWLPDDHLCYFISDLVDQLDLSAIYCSYDGSQGGQPPYHPLMMTKLLFYAYCAGVPSSRKMEKKTYEDVAFRIIAVGAHPDHDTISEFRHRHLKALAGLFVQVLQLCHQAGLVKLGHVSLDGTKVKANASKHKAMSYSRMKIRERELEKKVEELLKKAELVDADEDSRYGKGVRGDELPEELRFHQSRLKKIKEAKAALEAEAKQLAEQQRKESEVKEKEQKRKGKSDRGRKAKPSSGEPRAKAQRNFTDPDSRIMIDGSTKAFVQGYNCQALVDQHSQIIVATNLAQESNDKKQVAPMLEKMKKNVNTNPKKLSADAGYFSETNIELLTKEKIDVYIPPNKRRHNRIAPPPPRGRIPVCLSTADRMRRKLSTVKGRKIYAKRKEVVEPVFGQIKECRGLRQFLLRGVERVSPEWDIWCLTHNILKLFRSGCCPKPA